MICWWAGWFQSSAPKDLTCPSVGEGGLVLLRALTSLISLILRGDTPISIRPHFFGASLVALRKKDGGVCPIAEDCTLRRLAVKYAGLHALKIVPDILAPQELSFGVSRGVEAAVHAARIHLQNLKEDQVIVKVDFTNAFYSIRWDKMLCAVEKYGPTIHKLSTKMRSEFAVFYLDDGTLGGNKEDVIHDTKNIKVEAEALGLILNRKKTELICKDHISRRYVLGAFPGVCIINPEDANLCGSPIGGSQSVDAYLKEKLELQRLMGDRLGHLQSHDAITLLHHPFAIPKMIDAHSPFSPLFLF